MSTDLNHQNQIRNSGSGLEALCGIAAYYRVAVDRQHITRELDLVEKALTIEDILRAAKFIGMKARRLKPSTLQRLTTLPFPCIAQLISGEFVILAGPTPDAKLKFVDPIS